MLAHYEAVEEARRLAAGAGRIEAERTQEILGRHLPPPPAVVLDAGGGPGVHALWLAREGYEVHLVDPVPRHVEQGRRASEAQPARPIASLSIGDARRLERPDRSVDAALLLGPLYHLTGRRDRLAALREARRVLRRGGVLFAAVISRFASVLDGLLRGTLSDPEFARIVERDLRDGQHRNPTGDPGYFTTAYFHRPEEAKAEVEEAGLEHVATVAIEGPLWLLPECAKRWEDASWRERCLSVLRTLEAEPSLLGASAHILAVARRRD